MVPLVGVDWRRGVQTKEGRQSGGRDCPLVKNITNAQDAAVDCRRRQGGVVLVDRVVCGLWR